MAETTRRSEEGERSTTGREPITSNSKLFANGSPRQEFGREDIQVDEPTHDEIAARAYQCWQEHGCGDGSHEADWNQAEQELRTARAGQKQKSKSATTSVG